MSFLAVSWFQHCFNKIFFSVCKITLRKSAVIPASNFSTFTATASTKYKRSINWPVWQTYKISRYTVIQSSKKEATGSTSSPNYPDWKTWTLALSRKPIGTMPSLGVRCTVRGDGERRRRAKRMDEEIIEDLNEQKKINVEMGVWTFLKWRGCGLWLSLFG